MSSDGHDQTKDRIVTVKLPAGFRDEMMPQLLEKVQKTYGSDFAGGTVDRSAGTVTFVARAQVSRLVGDVLELPRHLAVATAGDRVASMIEEQRPGFVMVEFDPHRAIARLAKLSPDETVARLAVAEALGVKPWEIGIAARAGGGFTLTRLPARYTPSRHLDKLTEVAETKVPGGKPGWFVKVDGATLSGEIVPADLPTFAPLYRYDMESLRAPHRDRVPLGRLLPRPGQDLGDEFCIDFASSAFSMVAGLSGGGKSVALNAVIAGALAGGSELVIVDTADKAVDFLWCRDFVRPGGWGCESLEAAVAALTIMYGEGQRRAKVLRERGAVNWLELPVRDQFRPILAVVDEYAALVTPEKEPKALPKDDPIREEVNTHNMLRALIERMVRKITAEMRFTGLRLVVSSQVANQTTGLGPTQKTQMGHRLLLGSKPSDAARNQAFTDPQSVPKVPGNVQADKQVAKGVGTFESEGQAPGVFKSYFASTDDYRTALLALGIPVTATPEPTDADIAKHVPQLQADADWEAEAPTSRLANEGGWGERDGRDASEPRLKGAARASRELAVELRQAREA